MTAQQLKNSILQMAVQGKLVPQDPNDEPASVLLERIRAEKERLIKEKKIKREKNPSVIFKGADNTPYEKIGDEVRSLADEVPFDIPDSWEWVRLGNIGDWGAGATPSRTNPEYYGGNIPWLKTGDLTDSYIDAIPETITELALEKTSVRLNPAGSVLIAMYGATIGKLGILSIAATTNQACCACFPLGGLDNKYLFYFLMAQKPLFIKQGEGGAQPNISKEKIVSTLMPVPPLEEQRRIVVMLGQIFPIIDAYSKCKTELDLCNATFPERLKKSILQEAVQGKLVPQDPSDEPAEALLERIRTEKQRLIKEGKIKKDKHESVIFRRDNSHYEKRGSEELCIDDDIPFDIPDNWIWTRLQNICSLIGDIDHNMPKSVPADEGVLFLSAKDLLDDGTINFTQNVKFISRADFERLSRKALPQKHDIIYSRIGAALGKARLVETDREFLVSYSCCVVRPLLVYPQYIRYYLESPQILLHSIKARQSIGVPDLGMGEIKKYLVALPPYNEQVRIVEQLEVLLGRCNFKM